MNATTQTRCGGFTLALAAVCWAFGPAGGAPLQAQVYDVVNDFSLASNPNDPWSYGTLSSFTGGTFTLFTVPLVDHDYQGQTAWYNGQPIPNAAAADKNTSGSTVSFATIVQPPDLLRLDGENLIANVRWVSPADDIYDLEGLFQHVDTQAVPVSTHIILNGATELFAADGLMAFGDQRPFSFSELVLSAGDVLDFAEGAPQFNNDSTGLALTITGSRGGAGIAANPEPSSLLLLGLGGLGLLGYTWTGRKGAAKGPWA
jgi:hypothetical protein